jgi:hypothetical protein
LCGRPTFAPAATYATGTQPSGLAVGDFNHDNILDLAVANHASNDVSLLFGNTDGTFGPAVNRNLLGLNGPAEIATADFNQDGKLDVLVANSPNNAMWYALGNGDSTFQTYPQGYGTGYGATGGMVVGNISGFRSLDAALTKPDAGEVGIFYGNGTGGDAAALTFPAGPSPAGVALDHFNADSLTDLAIADSAADQVFILLGGGPFGFTAGGTFATGSQPNGVATADVNGDGRADLLVANSGSNTVSLLLGNGDATFQPAASLPVGTAPQRLAVGDFTGDNQVDVAVTNARSNTVSILQGNGDGTFQPPASIPVGASPLSVVVADFNDDGKADLAVTNRDDNSVSVLLNTCGTDAMPPATAATAMGTLGQDGWYTTDVSVALDARDETSVAAATASVSITAEGQTTLTYFATDNAGNAEPAKVLTVNVDKTPPITHADPDRLAWQQ